MLKFLQINKAFANAMGQIIASCSRKPQYIKFLLEIVVKSKDSDPKKLYNTLLVCFHFTIIQFFVSNLKPLFVPQLFLIVEVTTKQHYVVLVFLLLIPLKMCPNIVFWSANSQSIWITWIFEKKKVLILIYLIPSLN